MGELIKKFRRVKTQVLTVDTSAYTAGDAVDGLKTLTEALRGADQAGVIEQVVVADQDGQEAALDIFIFDSEVTGGTDNAAYAPLEAELKACLGVISVTAADYAATGNGSVATVNPSFSLQLESSQSLFFQVVTRGTPTYAGTDNLQVKFVINQD